MSITNILLQHGVYHGNRLVAQWANNVSHLAGRQSRNDFNNFTPSPPLVSGGCNFQDPPPLHTPLASTTTSNKMTRKDRISLRNEA